MAVQTFVSQPAMGPGVSVLICRQSLCQGDQLDLEFPDHSQQSARIVERSGDVLIIEVEGRRLNLRPWKKRDQSLPDYRGQASRWAVADQGD